jgi:hypothetical protein
MMSRRRFLQMTVSMAAVAAGAGFVTAEIAGGPPGPALGQIWVPTVPEVAEWLEYYKLSVSAAYHRFGDIVRSLSTENDDPEALVREFAMAERDFYALEHERQKVAYQQYSGYEAGRSGRPRHHAGFTKPSHEAFGWYNFWALGDYDRRLDLGLQRFGHTLEEEYRIQRDSAKYLQSPHRWYLPT